MIENKPETNYTPQDLEMLEKIRTECAGQFEHAVKCFNLNEESKHDWSWATVAAQQTAIATSATAWMEATDRLRQLKAGGPG